METIEGFKERLRTQLEIDEELRLFPYRDTVGKWTIGYGRNLTDKGISRDEADYMLDNDIDEHIEKIRANLAFFDSLSEPRQMVLSNMAFNLGVNGLLGFKNTLAAVAEGRYEEAARMMLQSQWARQVGERARRLSEIMRTGAYPDA
jgi:lysozyme